MDVKSDQKFKKFKVKLKFNSKCDQKSKKVQSPKPQYMVKMSKNKKISKSRWLSL